MRLILRYQVSDGCTYSCTVTMPVEYESAEALAVHFEQAMRDGVEARESETKFLDQEFYAPNFFWVDTRTQMTMYGGPDILTIDEWFAGA